ncbi:deoxyguanosine triphosphate triphosphohydrolase domain protein [Candidatus Erwinia dacicola]|uniref:Deoxyguanosine triphosphate triphosphohydrolase domain protein n=1 Tax=Candidatus Erwinia dacicola TaxID=252393 RepID=A0A328TNE0_9GAMM|nr:deoxyguanosine triphosphate triphosphohydrolase domain protein [Candidatus Erwinia dacicola]
MNPPAADDISYCVADLEDAVEKKSSALNTCMNICSSCDRIISMAICLSQW